MKHIVLILATMLCGLTTLTQPMRADPEDPDRIVIVSRVDSGGTQQGNVIIAIHGYYDLHHDLDGQLTLDVTDAECADDPLIAWFACTNGSGGLSQPVDHHLDDLEHLSTFVFPAPPEANQWYFRLNLWVDGVIVDRYYFFSGLGQYKP